MKIGYGGRFTRKFQMGTGMTSKQLLEGTAEIDNENQYIIYLLEDSSFIH